jgi:transposase-like protein
MWKNVSDAWHGTLLRDSPSMVSQVRSDLANGLRHKSSGPGDIWHLDEVFLKINCRLHYLRRAVDQDGEVLDI